MPGNNAAVCRMIFSLVIVCCSTQAGAQVEHSFKDLGAVLAAGDGIEVALGDGDEHYGRIVDISASTIMLRIDGEEHLFDEQEVNAIYRWQRGDPVLDGFFFGMFIGGAFGTLAFKRRFDVARPWKFFGILAGAGAGIGSGVDALLPGRRLIYRSGHTVGGLRLTPIVGDRGSGVAVSLLF